MVNKNKNKSKNTITDTQSFSNDSQRYQILLEHVGDLVQSIGPEGTILYVNQTWLQTLGYERSEILQQPFSITVKKDQLAHCQHIFAHLMQGKTEYAVRTVFLTKSGKEIPVEGTLVPIMRGKRMLYTCGVFRIISLSTSWVKQLQENEANYKLLFDLSPLAIAVFNTQARLVMVNKKITDWLGYQPSEVIGKNLLQLPYISSSSKVGIMQKFAQRILGKEIAPYDVPFIHKNGQKVIGRIIASPLHDHRGKIIGDLVMISDVTQRHHDEEIIKKTVTQYQSLYESINDGIVRVDLQGRILDCNQAYLTMLGYQSKEELNNVTYQQITPKKWHAFEASIIKNRVFTTGYSGEYEKEYIKKNQEVFPVSLRTWSIKDETGKLIALWAIVRDITNQKKIQQHLQRREKILEAVSYAAELLIGTVQWRDSLELILKQLGEAAEVSRAYILENQINEYGRVITNQQWKWGMKKIVPQVPKDWQAVDYVQSGLKQWAVLLSQGNLVKGDVETVSLAEKKFFKKRAINSLLLFPIFVNKQWWGCIGFDTCCWKREWSDVEQNALRTVATIIGSSIEQAMTLTTLQQKIHDIERLNQLMVGRELKMVQLKKQIRQLQSPSTSNR